MVSPDKNNMALYMTGSWSVQTRTAWHSIRSAHGQSRQEQRGTVYDPLMVSPDKNSMTLNNYDPLMVSPEKNSMTRYDYDPLMVSPDKNSMTRYDYDPLMVSPDRNSMTLYNYDPLMVSPDQNSMTPYKYDPLMVRPDKNSMALHITFYHASFLSIKASSGPYQHCVHSACRLGGENKHTNERKY